MFGGGFCPSIPLCPQSVMCPYDVPVPQPCPYPVPVPQPYIQNCIQPVDCPIQNTIQPIIVPQPFRVPVPQPVPVAVDRPCAVPVPQPVCVPVDRPCPVPVRVPVDRPCPVPVPVPVCVPVPQPCAVPQPVYVRQQVCVPTPVPVPIPVPMQAPSQYQCCPQQQYCLPPRPPPIPCYEEYMYEEPVCIKRRRRHHHRHHHHHHHRRHHSCTEISDPPPPIIIPIPIQGPTMVSEQPPLQITEYVQDIYPPAQVYTDQVPVGYTTSNSMAQQPPQIVNQASLDCRPGVILPPAPYVSCQPQLLQQLPTGQCVQRPLGIRSGSGSCIQTVTLPQQQTFLCPSNSVDLQNSSRIVCN